MSETKSEAAAGETLRRLYVYNGGFLTQKRIKRMLALAGYRVSLGKPGDGDLVGVWGQSPTSPRGEAVAAKTDVPVLRVEDAFLRSVLPGRDGEAPLGLHLDLKGVHFDPAQPSDLEEILARNPLDDTVLLNRARDAMARLQAAHLSKYNAFMPGAEVPKAGYVLVIDQTKGDAAVKASRADKNTFLEMLYYAQEENPGARIVVKSHPETLEGHREGYFDRSIENGKITLFDKAVSPWALFEGATKVYTVSSQMGFEAIFAGHKPHVFGQPFYAGWGLSEDRQPIARRQRNLTKAQLFAAAMILYPIWYDPYRDALCELEDAISTLEAEVRSWREDHFGWVALGMRMWKRKPLQQVFGRYVPVQFREDIWDGERPVMAWAGRAPEGFEGVRVEDGFLRSRGLGADLIAPLSLVCDTRGIYYDPNRESDLERLIAGSGALSDGARRRVERLVKRLISDRLSKYNLSKGPLPDLPEGRRILVPGQVEDDASILLGAGEVRTNLDLLKAAREANPEAVILYKPHPDVEAGLRAGVVENAGEYADLVLADADPMAVLDQVEAVWTMTSLLGFEALLRGKEVTCLGTPFYAGWGLTQDRGVPCARRVVRVDLMGMAHAVLIDYPRYFDPKTGRPCPVEVVVDRLASGDVPKAGPLNRVVAKLQGVFASYAPLWR
jgi:capsular polysaccharide export protein